MICAVLGGHSKSKFINNLGQEFWIGDNQAAIVADALLAHFF
jgi:hypothetical protein